MSAPIAEAIQATADQVGFKVFAGNLSFSTKDAELNEAFSKFGKVSDAQVIHRGTRSLGYGFVTFESETEATAAISALDKTELQGRPINVELAKPPTASAAGRAPKEAAQAAIAKGVTEGEVVVDGEDKPKKARKPRAKKARRPRTDAETEEAGDAPQEGAATNGAAEGDSSATEKPKRAPRQRKPRGAAATEGEGTDGSAPATSGGRPARRGPPTGEPSKTLVFVGNLAFSTTDDSLKAAFSEFGVEYARVVTKKFGASVGKSKGFGFVDFKTEDDQKKALETAQGREVDGRAVSIKVAIQEEKEADGATEQPAATKA